MRKNFLLTFFFLAISLTFAVADTLKNEVAKLDAEDSAQVLQSLTSNLFDPLPSTLFTNLGVRVSQIAHLTTEQNFSREGIPNFRAFYGWSLDAKWRISPSWRVGGTFIFAKRDYNKESVLNVIQQSTGSYVASLLSADYIFYEETHVQLLAKFGGGMVWGTLTQTIHNENPGGYTQTVTRQGDSFLVMSGIEARYYLNPIWSLSSSIHYLSGKIDTMKNLANREIPSAPDFNLNGLTIDIGTTLNL